MNSEAIFDILKENRLHRNEDEIQAFIKALDLLSEIRDPSPSLLGELHLLFDDEASDSEVIFQLIHYLESFPAEEQLVAFLDVLPEMILNAEDWATIFHFRIINDPPSSRIYLDILKKAKSESKEAARELLSAIAKEEEGDLKRGAEELLEGLSK